MLSEERLKKLSDRVSAIGLNQQEIEKALSAHFQMGERYRAGLALRRNDDLADNQKTIDASVMGIDRGFIELLDPLLVHAREQPREMGAALLAEADRARVAAQMLIATTAVVVGVCSIVAGILLALGISRPMGRLSTAMTRLAGGDLTATIPERQRRDEIGVMARLVQQFKDGVVLLHQQLEEISKNAVAVAKSSKTLSATSAEMSASSQQGSAMAQEVSASTEQVSQAVQSVTIAAEELTASIGEIAKTMAIAAKATADAVRQVEETTPTFRRLADLNQEIGSVVQTIAAIADQTNLLALNATIEAARAGEAGKGFAVVASEVKALAVKTAQATKDIGARIDAIRQGIDQATNAVGGITFSITTIHAQQSMIASAVEEQNATTSEITRAINEASQALGSTASSMSEVAKASDVAAHGALSTVTAAGELADIGAALQCLVSQVRKSAS